MNLSEMYTFVRAQGDTDVDDAPDSVLEVHARAAYQDIQARVYQWPHLLTEYTFTTTADQDEYNLSDIGSTLDRVYNVAGPDDEIIYIPRQEHLKLKKGLTESYSTVEADYFTTDGTRLFLYPTPSQTGTQYTVWGYRNFNTWPNGASSEPDLGTRYFDEPICWYILGKFYLFQEDLELAVQYMGLYEQAVNRHIQDSLRLSSNTASAVFGGGNRYSMSYADWVRRNTEG